LQLLSLSCLLAGAAAAPTAEGKADPQYYGGVPYHSVPAPNCVTEVDVLVTQICTPGAHEVCSTEELETEEIEYEKICQDVVDILCDAPAPGPRPYLVKREAEADPEADPQLFAPVHAVGHTVTETVRHACREITTEHCVDSPTVIVVPVTVEHCHTVTKVACEPVEHPLPRTVCSPVETVHVSPAPYGFAGYGYGYGK
jgi:hypothetical protein